MTTVTIEIRGGETRDYALPLVPIRGDDVVIDGVNYVVYDCAIKANAGSESSVVVYVIKRADIPDSEPSDGDFALPAFRGGSNGGEA